MTVKPSITNWRNISETEFKMLNALISNPAAYPIEPIRDFSSKKKLREPPKFDGKHQARTKFPIQEGWHIPLDVYAKSGGLYLENIPKTRISLKKKGLIQVNKAIYKKAPKGKTLVRIPDDYETFKKIFLIYSDRLLSLNFFSSAYYTRVQKNDDFNEKMLHDTSVILQTFYKGSTYKEVMTKVKSKSLVGTEWIIPYYDLFEVYYTNPKTFTTVFKRVATKLQQSVHHTHFTKESVPDLFLTGILLANIIKGTYWETTHRTTQADDVLDDLMINRLKMELGHLSDIPYIQGAMRNKIEKPRRSTSKKKAVVEP